MSIRNKVGIMLSRPHISGNKEAVIAVKRTYSLFYKYKFLERSEAREALKDIGKAARRAFLSSQNLSGPGAANGAEMSMPDPEDYASSYKGGAYGESKDKTEYAKWIYRG